VSIKLILQSFISFQKISIVFWIYHLAIVNKPGFPGICSVCNDPNFSTDQGEKQIIQGDCGKKDRLIMLINYNNNKKIPNHHFNQYLLWLNPIPT
jgi:hypothetical protein